MRFSIRSVPFYIFPHIQFVHSSLYMDNCVVECGNFLADRSTGIVNQVRMLFIYLLFIYLFSWYLTPSVGI